MTARPIPCYEIVCDEPGCETKTGDLSDFSGWGDIGYAEDEWRDGDNQVLPDGRHLCHKHRRPACVDCSSVTDVAEDEPDGDLYCPTCMPDKATGPRS